MKESNHPTSRLTQQQRIELELLHSVLDDDTTYPWNHYDPAAIAHLDALQAEAAAGELADDEFDSQWHQVAQIAGQLWTPSASSLTTALAQKFGTRMPSTLLNQLAASAQSASQSGLALIDQLVDSAQSILEGWESDDLRVMARPLAMAMRGGQEEVLEVTLRSIRPVEWEELNEMEQARLSLAIARYALGELSEQS